MLRTVERIDGRKPFDIRGMSETLVRTYKCQWRRSTAADGQTTTKLESIQSPERM